MLSIKKSSGAEGMSCQVRARLLRSKLINTATMCCATKSVVNHKCGDGDARRSNSDITPTPLQKLLRFADRPYH